MRIPQNHDLLLQYIKDFGLEDELFEFEMLNKFIYISGLGRTIPYGDDKGETPGTFNYMLVHQDRELLNLFPGLTTTERGQTCDQLFTAAVKPVVDAFWKAYGLDPKDPVAAVKAAYQEITNLYDRYSLRSYLKEVACWSEDAINLYDLGNAHVVFENGFIESFKDAFLSSNQGGSAAKMQQLQPGMDAVPNAFISPDRKESESRHINDSSTPSETMTNGNKTLSLTTSGMVRASEISASGLARFPAFTVDQW
jgi:monoamine oxidase